MSGAAGCCYYYHYYSSYYKGKPNSIFWINKCCYSFEYSGFLKTPSHFSFFFVFFVLYGFNNHFNFLLFNLNILSYTIYIYIYIYIYIWEENYQVGHLSRAVEYTDFDCTSAEGLKKTMSILDMTLNSQMVRFQ